MTADYYAMLHDEDLRPITANEIDGGSRRRGDVAGGSGEAWKDSWRLHYLMRLVLFTRKPNHISNLIGDPGPQSRHSMLYTLLGDRKARDCITLAAQHAERSGEMDVAIQLFRRTRNRSDFNRALRLLNVELSSCMQPSTSSERRAEYESFAWEFVRTHLVNPNVSSDYVDQSSFLTGEGREGSMDRGGQAELRFFLAQTRALKCQLAMCKFFKCMYDGNWVEARVRAREPSLFRLIRWRDRVELMGIAMISRSQLWRISNL